MTSSSDIPPTEDLGHGVTLQRLSNGQITAFTIRSTARDAIDTCVDILLNLAAAEHDQHPCVALLDLSALGGLTTVSYLKDRLAEIMQVRSGRIAVVIGNSFMVRLATLLVCSQSSRGIEVCVFPDRNKAMAWLEEIVHQ